MCPVIKKGLDSLWFVFSALVNKVSKVFGEKITIYFMTWMLISSVSSFITFISMAVFWMFGDEFHWADVISTTLTIFAIMFFMLLWEMSRDDL